MPQITSRVIQKIADRIGNEIAPEKVVLYGSYAWGSPNEDSDIDLFVIQNTSDRRIDRARKIRKIIWEFGLPVDILVYTPEEVNQRLKLGDFFIDDITQKGKTLWTKEK